MEAIATRLEAITTSNKKLLDLLGTRTSISYLAEEFSESRQAAIGFMKFLFWFQSLPQFTVGLAQDC